MLFGVYMVLGLVGKRGWALGIAYMYVHVLHAHVHVHVPPLL